MPGGRTERRRGRKQRGAAGAAVEKRKGAPSPAAIFGHRKRACSSPSAIVVADFVSFAATILFGIAASHSLRRSSSQNRTRWRWAPVLFSFGFWIFRHLEALKSSEVSTNILPRNGRKPDISPPILQSVRELQSTSFEPLQHQNSIISSSQISRATLPRFPKEPRKLASARLLLLFKSKQPLRFDSIQKIYL